MAVSDTIRLILDAMRKPDGVEVKKGVRLTIQTPVTFNVSISALDTITITLSPAPRIKVRKLFGVVNLEGLVKQFQITPTTINIVIDGLPDQQIVIQ